MGAPLRLELGVEVVLQGPTPLGGVGSGRIVPCNLRAAGSSLPAASTRTGGQSTTGWGPVKVVSLSWQATWRMMAHAYVCQNSWTRFPLVGFSAVFSAYSRLRRCRNCPPVLVVPAKGCVTRGMKFQPRLRQCSRYLATLRCSSSKRKRFTLSGAGRDSEGRRGLTQVTSTARGPWPAHAWTRTSPGRVWSSSPASRVQASPASLARSSSQSCMTPCLTVMPLPRHETAWSPKASKQDPH